MITDIAATADAVADGKIFGTTMVIRMATTVRNRIKKTKVRIIPKPRAW